MITHRLKRDREFYERRRYNKDMQELQKKMSKRPKYFKDIEQELPSEYSGKYNDPILKKQQMQTDGILYADSFSLDTTIAIFMYSHLMHYKDNASKMIVLDDMNDKYPWQGEEITLLDAINILATFFKMYAETSPYVFYEKVENIKPYFELFAEIYPALWW